MRGTVGPGECHASAQLHGDSAGGDAPTIQALEREVVALRARTAELESILDRLAEAEEQVLGARAQAQALLDNIPHMAWMKNRRGVFLAVNEGFARACGYPKTAILGKTDRDVWPLEHAEKYMQDDQRMMASGEKFFVEERIVEGGDVKWFETLKTPIRDARGLVIGTVGLARDITDRKRAEEQRQVLERRMLETQKLESLGVLAGGIAHDFNNLLTAIQGYATLVSDSLPDHDPRKDDVEEISRASDRAAELTRQLLAFSRKQMFEPRVLEPSRVVKELAPMLRRLVHETIDVTTVAAAKGRVKADPVQLQQVMMNLVVNARDAIGDGGGRITVETADVVLDETYTDTHAVAHTGPHVMLAVSDTGHGMDAQTQARIFEPFFTTKPQGRGTGLGLSTVYGIVQQSNGHVWVYSEVGRGTTFKVYLPVTEEATMNPVTEPVPQVPHNAAHILLLEDEDAVRRLVMKVLQKRGYIVHAAGRPAEALAMARQGDLRIDLLLTDVVMPDMSGRAVADAVQDLHPNCRVLFMSGYTDDAIVRHGVLHAEALFLQKPFRADDLAQKVSEALAGKVAMVLSSGSKP